MAVELRVFTVTVATGTTKAAPQKTAITTPPRVVTKVEVMVPPGPRGCVGFQVAVSGNPLYPVNPTAWVVTDDDTVTITPQDAPTSGAWYLNAYNTGTYTHTLQVRLYLDLTGSTPASAITPITTGAIEPTSTVPGVGVGTAPVVTPPTLTPPPVTVTPPPVLTTPPVPTAPVVPAPVSAPTPTPISAPAPVTPTAPVVPAPVITPPAITPATPPQVTDLNNQLWYILGGFTPQGLYVGRTVGGDYPVAWTWTGQGKPEIGQLPPRGSHGVVAYTPTTTPLTAISAPHGPQVAPWAQDYTGTA